MSKFFDDTMQGLLEAIEIEKGTIPVLERKDMAEPTIYVSNSDTELIDRLVEIHKKENISQAEIAKMTGSKQQAISRLEKKEHIPFLKLFYNMVNALGYEVQIVKKQ
ncbi:MAG: helix-turn-helix transcriptional regulator [Lachnospiraceae bacterium]|nr:helix-turn-helix transcriptional regulator [Lachnospiraceae bacterium]